MAPSRPMIRTYLDYNATAPLRPEAREAALSAMAATGNPSSIHAEGRLARRIVEDAPWTCGCKKPPVTNSATPSSWN